MYNGKNPTALRSQSWIRNSFLELLKVKPYEKITIKEIVQNADLARQTFYQLFSSKEEILEYHLDELFNDYRSIIVKSNIKNIQNIAELCFAFFDNNSVFIKILIDNHLTNLLNRKFYDYLFELKSVIANDKDEPLSNYITAFISGALVEILVYWFKDNRSVSIDEVSKLVTKILEGLSLKHYHQRLLL